MLRVLEGILTQGPRLGVVELDVAWLKYEGDGAAFAMGTSPEGRVWENDEVRMTNGRDRIRNGNHTGRKGCGG